uniref:CRAL-TRIO domain-containing protein n=1 Tax=Meloidogyne hapla TaxID=6305 RepID=A0A1I8BFN9_MELHA
MEYHKAHKLKTNEHISFSDVLNTSLNYWLSDLPVIDNWCGRMSNGLLSDEEADRLANWNVNQSTERYLPGIKKQNPAEMPEAGCKNLKRLFPFPEEPATEEELQFPLAYGILVHKSPLQVFLLMSVIYQPQNAYCLAVDGFLLINKYFFNIRLDRADEQFKKQMNLLMDCFSNIFVMTVNKVEWCEFGVVRGVFNCLRYLSELDHKWRYYQMVRIFKKLNGTLNAEILPFETSRIKELYIPGGFDANYLYGRLFKETYLSDIKQKQIQKQKEQEKEQQQSFSQSSPLSTYNAAEPFKLSTYYISRFQVWKVTNQMSGSKEGRCDGKFVASSCVYGIGDMERLLKRPELIAHKLYLDFEPAAIDSILVSLDRARLDEAIDASFVMFIRF